MPHVHRALGLAAIAASAALVLSACSGTAQSPSTDAGTSDAPSAHLTLQLRFIMNAQFGGSYLADQNGHYADEHLSVTLLPGGGSVAPDPVVAQGSADIGITTADSIASSVKGGAPLKVIAAAYQHSGSVIMSLPSHPIRSMNDLKGKKLGVLAANLNRTKELLKLNGLNPQDVTLVTIQGDAAPLLAGSIDAMSTNLTSQPVALRAQGIEPVLLKYSDIGFDTLDMLYFVTDQTLSDPKKRAEVVRFLRAEREGWADMIADPKAAAKVAVDIYGKGLKLDLDQQVGQAEASIDLLQSADTKKHGLMWMSPEAINYTLATLKNSGNTADASLFDTSLLEEASK